MAKDQIPLRRSQPVRAATPSPRTAEPHPGAVGSRLVTPARPPEAHSAPASSAPPEPANVLPATVAPQPEAVVITRSDPKVHSAPASSAPPEPTNVFPAIVDPQPEALVITCSDPRFHAAFRQFVEGALGLRPGKYVSFTVAGGGGVLARPDTLPKEFKFMRDRIELFRGQFHSLKRLIVVNHEDCAYYKELSRKAAWLQRPIHAHLPRDDMQSVAQVFARSLSHLGMALEMYYAQFVASDRAGIVIDRVETGRE